jgi:imidazolonepropionase-like amidohydrolase
MNAYTRTVIVAIVVVLALAPGLAAAQDVLIRGARIYTMTGQGVIEPGDVLVQGGKIAAIGASLPAPRGIRIIEGRGIQVMPGLIDLHSHMATQDERGGGSDRHERGQRVNTALRILDSVNPQYRWLHAALEGGVTVLHVMPGSNAAFGGQTVVIKSVPKATVDEMLVKRTAGMKMSMAATRGTGTSEMREWFTKGQEYIAKWDRWEKSGHKGPEPKRDLQLEGVAMQLKRELVTHTHAQTALEMEYALKMKREFGLDLVLHHAFDGWKIVDDIKNAGVGVSYGPVVYSFANESYYTPGLLAKAGVKVTLNMDSASDFQRHLLHEAQICVRFGMERIDALKAVTINGAELLKIDDRVGSLAPGKDGDLVVFDGDPLSTFAHVLYTIVDGKIAYERPRQASPGSQGAR